MAQIIALLLVNAKIMCRLTPLFSERRHPPTCVCDKVRHLYLNIIFLFFCSRNQLSYLPDSICGLSSLKCLIVNNNRLVSLPEEIGRMQELTELDASCNEITHLPVQIGDMTALRSLNLRRNHLQEVPVGTSLLHYHV